MRVEYIEQIVDLFVVDADLGRVALVAAIGRADQAETLLVGEHENDATILVLKNVGPIVVVESRHDQVAALNHADAVTRITLGIAFDEGFHPGAGGVDQHLAPMLVAFAGVPVFEADHPVPRFLASLGAAGANPDVRAFFLRLQRIEDHQPGIIHPAV